MSRKATTSEFLLLKRGKIDGRSSDAARFYVANIIAKRQPGIVWVEDEDSLGIAEVRVLARWARLAATAKEEIARRLIEIGFQRVRLWTQSDGDIERFLEQESDSNGVTVQVQGPFETSYSLAQTNRRLALSLHERKQYRVSIYATEGPGDYEPDASLVAQHTDAAELYGARRLYRVPEVVIRQMWPPRLGDTSTSLTLQYFAWEETRLPKWIVDLFNQHADGVGVISDYVGTVLKNSGVTVPICTVGIGIEDPLKVRGEWAAPPQELIGMKPTRFLHISTALPRKGVDVLLRAFYKAFSGRDPVTLILKTSPNPHNRTETLLEELNRTHDNPPDVRWIDREISEGELAHLFREASIYVHPARAEGFGMPVGEAMACGCPVIATNHTGLAAIVNPETAWIVPSQEVPASSHVSEEGSTWFEPDENILAELMNSLMKDLERPETQAKTERAKCLMKSQYDWTMVASRWEEFIELSRLSKRGLRLSLVSSYNSECGIASYSQALVQHFDQKVHTLICADLEGTPIDWQLEQRVDRCWWPVGKGDIHALHKTLNRQNSDVVHIQTNYGLLGLDDLASTIDSQISKRAVVVTLHRTTDRNEIEPLLSLGAIRESLSRCSAIVVHQSEDAERLRAQLSLKNIVVIPHGTHKPVNKTLKCVTDKPKDKLVLGTFGFLLPHKGLDVLIRACGILIQKGFMVRLVANCALHRSPESQAQLQKCQAIISNYRLEEYVEIRKDFQELEDIFQSLSKTDLLVLPYLETGESCSGSLHSLLPLGIPIITSRLGIFSGAAEAGALFQYEDSASANCLSEAILTVSADKDLQAELTGKIRAYTEQTSWEAISSRHSDLYRKVIWAQQRAKSLNDRP